MDQLRYTIIMKQQSDQQHTRKDPLVPALDFSILQDRFDTNYPAKIEYGEENSILIHDDDSLDIKTPLLSDTHIPLAQELRSKVMQHGSQLDTYYQDKSLFAAKMKHYLEQINIQELSTQEQIAFTQALSYLDERAKHYI